MAPIRSSRKTYRNLGQVCFTKYADSRIQLTYFGVRGMPSKICQFFISPVLQRGGSASPTIFLVRPSVPIG
jgi:hypothetical protein